MAKTICCIGCGVMGGAILEGLAHKIDRGAWALCGYNRTGAKMARLEKLGVEALSSAAEAAKRADILILGVKPYQVGELLREIAPAIGPHTVLVSLAAGVSLADLQKFSGRTAGLCRCMPTTTAQVGEGIFAFCFDEAFASRQEILTLFGLLGECVTIGESRMADFSALIGAGPAYVFQLMQGLAQAGVTLGFPHAEARKLVCALFRGAAIMAQASPKPLPQLRDEVCSPAGLTIYGVNVLDTAGQTGILIQAVQAAAKRAREMEGQSDN